MAFSPELLTVTRCPKCKSKVELVKNETALRCTNEECRLVYPIEDDIPALLVEKGKRED